MVRTEQTIFRLVLVSHLLAHPNNIPTSLVGQAIRRCQRRTTHDTDLAASAAAASASRFAYNTRPKKTSNKNCTSKQRMVLTIDKILRKVHAYFANARRINENNHLYLANAPYTTE